MLRLKLIKFSKFHCSINTLWSEQWPRFAENICKCIFLIKTYCILIQISLNFVSRNLINLLRPSDAWTVPSHYLNQWWNIVNWNLRNKLHWNLNSYIFIQENAFQNIVCEMAAILSLPQCVNNMSSLVQVIARHRISDKHNYLNQCNDEQVAKCPMQTSRLTHWSRDKMAAILSRPQCVKHN